jgi:formate hydrogenlyase subunit 3/multisubunit Na+/H+ antiporter MnhD subunit
MTLILVVVFLLLAGAVAIFGLSLIPRLRPYARYGSLAVVGLVTVLTLVLRWTETSETVPSLWRPSGLFGVAPVFRSDTLMQPLVFVMALSTAVTELVMLSREDNPPPRLLAIRLGMLASGFAALWGSNPLAVIIGWAVYDLLLAAQYVSFGGAEGTAVRALTLGSLATLLLWGGTLFSGGSGGSVLWTLMKPSQAQLTLWIAAGVLRLWIFPFHLRVPDEMGAQPSSNVSLLGPVLGWGLCLRLLQTGGDVFAENGWVSFLAALTMGVGGFLAWTASDPRSVVPWIGMCVTATTLLSATLLGDYSAVIISTGCVAWALAVTVLLLSDDLHREAPWWSIPALIGSLALIGLPTSVGFISQLYLLGGIARTPRIWWLLAFFLGNALLIAALTRRLRVEALSPLPSSYWLLGVRGVALGLPAFLLLASVLFPSLLVVGVDLPSLGMLVSLPRVAGWGVGILALVGGGVLGWQDENVRARLSVLMSAAHDFVRLDWFNESVVGAMEQGLRVLRVVDEVVGGAGSLLWSMLLFLVILLVWSSQ